MAHIEYSEKIFPHLKQALWNDILQSPKSMPNLRKEIARVFQVANRRIQNVEKSGLFSPAVAALNKGDITGYSKFSMSGKDWTELKMEYGKAVTFLRKPTSVASGAREYNEHIRKSYDLTPDEYKLMSDRLQDKLTSIEDEDFVERYLMRYKDFSGELEEAAADISEQLESDAVELANQLEQDIENTAVDVANSGERVSDMNTVIDLIDIDKNGI
jgi:gas vesicle protein